MSNTGGPIECTVTTSFFHNELISIVFGESKPSPQDFADFDVNNQVRSEKDLRKLAAMVKVEFLAALQKEIDYPGEESDKRQDPHAYDVFLMDRLAKTKLGKFMVLVPAKRRLKHKKIVTELVWLDMEGRCWPLQPSFHTRKVGSLSGPVRVLEALATHPLHRLKKAAMERQLIHEAIPTEEAEELLEGMSPEFTDGMNESQRRAVGTLCSRSFDEGFFVVQGPPGCGKTTTMVAMISAVGDGMVVAAPSNAAVANVALKLFRKKRFDHRSICVFGENCDPSVQFLNPVHRGKAHLEFQKRLEELEDDESREKERRRFAWWLNVDPHSTSLTELAIMCPYYDLETKFGRRSLEEAMASCNVVFSTLNGMGATFLQHALEDNVHTILLDEAGQCTEAEFYIATSFARVRRVVVVGDPQQLPATVIDPSCQAAGLGSSWMGHVHHHSPDAVHLLDTQYRMDPHILAFPNKRFYSNRINSGDNVFGRLPHIVCPWSFVNLKGRGKEAKDGLSWRNDFEVTAIKALLKGDKDIVSVRKHVEDARVIVLSPYRAQTQLLRETLGGAKGLRSVGVETVDSFQGQEADVVIISTVRTHRVGFVDNDQRLNVALTRAKRVLRVVGDASFFLGLRGDSTLKNVVLYATHNSVVEESPLNTSLVWTPPDWSQRTLWKPVMTQRFGETIRKMSEGMRTVALNTLLALAIPTVDALYSKPMSKPSWHHSALKGHHRQVQIVWVFRNRAIEAHFAGSVKECLNFVQSNKVPSGTEVIERNLCGFVESPTASVSKPTTVSLRQRATLVWKLSNPLQNREFAELPEQDFCLDPLQDEVVAAPPPVIINSRSGTGKTNVLFRHALAFADSRSSRGSVAADSNNPICFVTVSPRLARHLQNRYRAIQKMNGDPICKIVFYALTDLLNALAQVAGLETVRGKSTCCYTYYANQRTSHEPIPIDKGLVENEIGGVIVGSLEAALQEKSLTREQYMLSKRSNISVRHNDGVAKRRLVYDQFELYNQWKLKQKQFDLNDIVMKLLQEGGLRQHFESVYLDEVQDFSYSAIFLLLSIGGTSAQHWVCAGDTAQMISPGCSFTFDGLKQTMLAVQSGIEPKLRTVHFLLRNYRTTKDVLEVANEVLLVLKRFYPNAIEYAKEEVAINDLGLRVVLCEWKEAIEVDVSFGHNQALIFSSQINTQEMESFAHGWVGEHPLVLSALESKGLEFDDVVVAFKLDRKAWDVRKTRMESLSMLRELYVAITRAKRRVVILVRSDVDKMLEFFTEHLSACRLEFMEARRIMAEFDTKTRPEVWFRKGREYFDDEKYKLASSCFAAARNMGWSLFSQGMYEEDNGAQTQASSSFRLAAKLFCESSLFKECIDSLTKVRDLRAWNVESDGVLFEEAKRNVPTYLSRSETIKFALSNEDWHVIKLHDLTELSTAPLLMPYRTTPFLKQLIANCSTDERTQVEAIFPGAVADHHIAVGECKEAVRLYLAAGEIRNAEEITSSQVDALQGIEDVQIIGDLAMVWSQSGAKPKDPLGVTTLLLATFESPLKAASDRAVECMQKLGPSIIKLAVQVATLDPLELHKFDSRVFHHEVVGNLTRKFPNNPMAIIRWFLRQKDMFNANSYATKTVHTLSADELLVLLNESPVRPGGFVKALEKKKLLMDALPVFLDDSKKEYQLATEVSDHLLKTPKLVSKNADKLVELWAVAERDSHGAAKNENRSKISSLLLLFRAPWIASTTIPRQCVQTFGHSVVVKAVLMAVGHKHVVPLELLPQFDKKFCSYSHWGVIKLYLKYQQPELAEVYCQRFWKEMDDVLLKKIFFDLKVVPERAYDELVKRDLRIEAVELAIIRQELDIALRLSDLALNTHKRAERSASHVWALWQGHVNYIMTVELCQSHPLRLLQLLLDDPSVVLDAGWRFHALKLMGPSVLHAVLLQRDTRQETQSLIGRLVEFHRELKQVDRVVQERARMQSRRRQLDSGNTVASVATTDVEVETSKRRVHSDDSAREGRLGGKTKEGPAPVKRTAKAGRKDAATVHPRSRYEGTQRQQQQQQNTQKAPQNAQQHQNAPQNQQAQQNTMQNQTAPQQSGKRNKKKKGKNKKGKKR